MNVKHITAISGVLKQCIKRAGTFDFKADPVFGLCCILTNHRAMTLTTMSTALVKRTKFTALFTKQHILWSPSHANTEKIYLIIAIPGVSSFQYYGHDNKDNQHGASNR